MPITDRDKLKEIRRELSQRERVYPRLIEQIKLRKYDADRQMTIMKAIELDYATKVAAQEEKERLI